MKTKERKGPCPRCGAVSTNTKKGFTPTAAVADEDPGIGIVVVTVVGGEAPPKLSNHAKTAQERIEALRNAGVDVDNLFAIQGANGGEYIASNKDGRLAILGDDDPIFKSITEQGTVPNRSLFRRWVTAQMFHMMAHIPYGHSEPVGVTEMIHNLGFEYQWKMLLNELYAQMKMEGRDAVNFADRNRWFNTRVVAAMAQDYIAQLKKRVDDLPEKKCKSIPYKRIGRNDIFVSDLYKKLYSPLYLAMKHLTQAKNAAQLYNATQKFNDLRLKMAWETPQSKAWVDAYKGAGAFFTMQNLIRFHNCTLVDDKGRCLDKLQSLAFLAAKAKEYKIGEGWRLLAVLKKMLEDNGINIKKKMAQWRKRK